MLNKLKQYLLFGNVFHSVEIIQEGVEGNFIFCSVKKNRNELTFVDKQVLDSINELNNSINKKIGFQLVINDNNVLTKRIDSSNSRPDQIVNVAFPNLNLNEFYYNILKQSNKIFIAICRKKYVDQLINDFSNNGFFVTGFQLGNLGVSSLLPYLKNDIIFTNNAEIINSNGQITSIKNNEVSEIFEYDINGLKVTNQYLLPLSAILKQLITNKNEKDLIISDSINNTLQKEYIQKQFFNQFLKLGLGILFVTLLINFIFYSHYYNKVNELNQINQVNVTAKEQLTQLKSDVDKKEKFINDILKSGVSKSSFYTSEIINSMPNSILLTELNYQPLLKRVKEEKPIEYEMDNISISGESNSSQDISDWVSILGLKDWIEGIVITDFGENKGGLTQFSLKIQIK